MCAFFKCLQLTSPRCFYENIKLSSFRHGALKALAPEVCSQAAIMQPFKNPLCACSLI